MDDKKKPADVVLFSLGNSKGCRSQINKHMNTAQGRYHFATNISRKRHNARTAVKFLMLMLVVTYNHLSGTGAFITLY